MKAQLETYLDRDNKDVFNVVLDDGSDVVRLQCMDQASAIRLLDVIAECAPGTAIFHCCFSSRN